MRLATKRGESRPLNKYNCFQNRAGCLSFVQLPLIERCRASVVMHNVDTGGEWGFLLALLLNIDGT